MITILDHKNGAQAKEIEQVMQLSYQEEANLLQIADFPPLRRTAKHIQATDALFFGYKIGTELVALAEIENEAKETVNIASFVVLPNMFRKGIGTKLLEYVLARYAAYTVTVSTAKENLPAIGLYTKRGFKVAESWFTPDNIAMVTLCKEDAH